MVVVLAPNNYRKRCPKLETNHPTSFPLELHIVGIPTYFYLDSLNRIWLKKCVLNQLVESLTVVLE